MHIEFISNEAPSCRPSQGLGENWECLRRSEEEHLQEGRMVHELSATASSNLAIDDAIGHLDSLILRLQTAMAPAADPPAAPVIDAPAEPSKKEESLLPMVSLESAKLTAEQQEAGKGSYLDRPGKKSLKLPGVADHRPSKSSSAGIGSDHEENFAKAHLQVGLVQSVDEHPISGNLYICKVEVTTGQIRQVVAGLRNFIPVAELEGKKVALVLNLKPAKLAGQLSEAMILAGDSHADGVETVKVLEPPSDASVGDRIYLEGGTPSASPVKQLSSKIWEKVVSILKVEGGVATFNRTPLVTSSGVVKVPKLPDGAGIH